MLRITLSLLMAALLLPVGQVSAQAASPPDPDNPRVVSPYQDVWGFAGPGIVNAITLRFTAGTPLTVVERNAIGSWLRVQTYLADGAVASDAWIIGGYVNKHPDLRYSDVPINTNAPEHDLAYAPAFATRDLYAPPVVPPVSEAMLAVFQRGQALGNHPDVILRVGDSLSTSEQYLVPLSLPDAALGPFDFLADVVAYYGPSATGDEVSAQVGMSSIVLFDPMWANDPDCAPGETPLACAYRVRRPSVAFVMFGPNDVRSMDPTRYAENMGRIVQESLDAGVIPVLTLVPLDPESELYARALAFHRELIAVADAFDVPLINLWYAAQGLPENGLDIDGVHLKQSGFDTLKLDSGHEAWYGISLHNLLSLVTLDRLYHTLGLDTAPTDTIPDLTPTPETAS